MTEMIVWLMIEWGGNLLEQRRFEREVLDDVIERDLVRIFDNFLEFVR